MDVKRYALIGSLSLVTYFLVLAWNEDYGNVSAPIPIETNRLDPISSPQTMTREDILNESSQALPDNLDVPTDVSIVSEVPVTENLLPEQLANINNQRIIEVSSDIFKAQIDLKGGDIINLSLIQYPQMLSTPDTPLIILENNNRQIYVSQSGLIGPDGPDGKEQRPLYRSTQNNYRLESRDDQLDVVLTYQTDNNVLIEKIFTFKRGQYLIEVSYNIDNQSNDPFITSLFAQIKRDSQLPQAALEDGVGMAPYVGGALTTSEDPYYKLEFDDLSEKPYKTQVTGGWIAMLQHYFVTAWIPNPEQTHTYTGRKLNNQDLYIIGLVSSQTQVNPQEKSSINAQFYAGPKLQYTLETISPNLDLTIDYGIFWWLAQPLFWLLYHLEAIFGNWGVAIILLTVIVKLAFFQLSATSYRSMANMRRVQPEMTRIRDAHGGDRQKMSQAMMELYKKEKINPLGGCLPILVQMPVFIALYWTLIESVELRHAPFMLWIYDLSVKDPYFILPILMGITMLLQQRMNPEPPDPMQARIMKLMPIMFTFFFLWFPAGLVLYWFVNNLLSIAQQYVIMRQIEGKPKPKPKPA